MSNRQPGVGQDSIPPQQQQQPQRQQKQPQQRRQQQQVNTLIIDPIMLYAVWEMALKLPSAPVYAVIEMAWDFEFAAIFDCHPPSSEST